MRFLVISLFVLLLTAFNLSSGGGKWDDTLTIAEEDTTFHQSYYSVIDSLFETDGKGKLNFVKRYTSNIAIHDHHSDKTVYLFQQKNGLNVLDFFFEDYFLDSTKSIFFRHVGSRFNSPMALGNMGMKRREPAPKIFVVTENRTHKEFVLWMANRNGSQLQELYKGNVYPQFYLDTRNRKVRVILPGNDALKVAVTPY
jgi:hypothetical protein